MNTLLQTPIKIGPYHLPNRIVMAPLTRMRAPENCPTDLMVTYYAQRASAELIISEATQISPQGVGYPATPGIHNELQVAGWKKITEAVHAKKGHIFLQLWHVGRISHPDFHDGQLLVAPSAITPKGDAVTLHGMNPFRLAYLHIVDALEGDIRHGANVINLEVLRKAYNGILIVCGGYDQARAEQVIAQGMADAVAFGQLYIANPDLVERFKLSAPLNEPDPATFYGGDEKGYTDYPVLMD